MEVFLLSRVFKELDYCRLIVLLYKTSGLDRDILVLLFCYVVDWLRKYNFNEHYIDKLMVDLNMFDVEVLDMPIVEGRLGDLLGVPAFVLFRSLFFDVVSCGYYS